MEMSEQRVNFSTRDEARLGLADWYAGRFNFRPFIKRLMSNNDVNSGEAVAYA